MIADLAHDIEEYGIASVSYAIHGGAMRQKINPENKDNKEDSKIIKWIPEQQVIPVSSILLNYFASQEYISLVEKYTNKFKNNGKFYIDWENDSGYALSFKTPFNHPVEQLFGSPQIFKKK